MPQKFRPNLLPMFPTKTTSRWWACRRKLSPWRQARYLLLSHPQRELCTSKCLQGDTV